MEKYTATFNAKKTFELSVNGSKNEAKKIFTNLANIMGYDIINIKKNLPKKD